MIKKINYFIAAILISLSSPLYAGRVTGGEIGAGGTATPAGADTDVQFNDSGSFGGESDFTYSSATNLLTVPQVDATTGTFTAVITSTIQNSAGVTAIEINPNGEVNQPLQPAFLVVRTSQESNVTGQGENVTINYDSEITDQGSDFASSTFTAPIDGNYRLDFAINIRGLVSGTHTDISYFLVTSNRTYRGAYTPDTGDMGSIHTVNLSVLADMDANDIAYVTFLVNGSTSVIDVFGDGSNVYTYFSGSLEN